MSAVTFDTHRIVKQLQSVGFTEEQAEAVTSVVQASAVHDLSHFATREQLAAVAGQVTALDGKVSTLDSKVSALDSKVSALEERVERRGAESDSRMMRWVVGTGVAAVLSIGSIVVGAAAFLLKALPLALH